MKLTEEAFHALETATDEEGFERVAVIRKARINASPICVSTDDTPALLSSYPNSWTERYFDLRYQKIDPVVQRAAKECDLFSWRGAPIIGAAKEQQGFFDEATTFGLKSGITVPIRMALDGFRIAAFTVATVETLAGTDRVASRNNRCPSSDRFIFSCDRPLGKPLVKQP